MQGWGARGPAENSDEIVAGVRLPWIELDGHRISDGVVSAEFVASKEDISRCKLTLEIMGPIEIVYIDKDGHLFPGFSEEIDPVDAHEVLGSMDHTAVVRPNPSA